jgi:hypothetical protein
MVVVLWACTAAIDTSAQGAPKGVVEVQAREAQRTDGRLLAYLARFKAALSAREGGDPQVVMLKASEVEGEALVIKAPGAPAEHVIWQEGQWIPNAGRQLRPWAAVEVAAAHAFRVSQVREATVREAIRAYRRMPDKATDFVGDLAVGFESETGTLIARLATASLTGAGLGSFAFDLASGMRVVIVRAPPPAPPGPAPRKSEDLRNDVAQAFAALRSVTPRTRLGAVRIEKERIDITLADRSTYRFDPTFTLQPDVRYDGIWLCEKGFLEEDVDWGKLPDLAHNAVLIGRLDDEDEPHVRYIVDRSRECGPVEIDTIFDNYETPQPWVKFDARGRYKSTSR